MDTQWCHLRHITPKWSWAILTLLELVNILVNAVRHTVHADPPPPVEFGDRQTDRVISGQTDTHITLSTPTPRSSFGTDRQRDRERERDSLYGGGAR